jgi:hypothetical protein
MRTLVVAVMLLLLTAGCTFNAPYPAVGDLAYMPQQPSAYLAPDSADQLLVPPAEHAALAADFLKMYFAPWHTDTELDLTRKPFAAINWISTKVVYGANLRPLEQKQVQSLIALANQESYPSQDRRAISLRRIDLRALPSSSPIFSNPRRAGEGFPFDYLQHSVLPANTPVHVTHLSSDGSWAFVETLLVDGWVSMDDIAWVDAACAQKFITGSYLAFTRDEVAVQDLTSTYRFKAEIGGLLPIIGKEAAGYRVLLAVADVNRQAQLTEALISSAVGQLFPLPLTPRRITGLADQMMGQVYGWGGLLGGRDCSATLRDLFVPFGLWLPRNSSKQAKVGVVIPLADLPPDMREQLLISAGIPFFTLVRVPGHIMLYLGAHEGQAAVLHTLWGLRTRSITGREGRWVVGKTVVTTLQPGLEKNGFFHGVSNLRNRIESMNLLLPVKYFSGNEETSSAP